MRSFKSLLILVSSAGLLFLGACSSSNQATNPSSSPTTNASATQTQAKSGEAKKGGQVIESGAYHLEFVPEKEADAFHLDFYLLKDTNHEPIPNAKVTAQVQLPDGNQKSLDLKYDANGKHYTAILPGTTVGDYKVAILSDINGKKVNGRFSFKR